MSYIYFRPDRAIQKTCPFVCLNKPFIGYNNPSITPFVRLKYPFVWYARFSGFSFVELLIAATVVAILGFISAPGMMNFVRDNRLTTVANDLISDISLARNEAVRRGSPVVICKIADPTVSENSLTCNTIAAWTNGWIIFLDTDDDGQRDTAGTPETLIKLHSLLQNNMTLSSYANVDNYLRFRPSGRPAASAGIGAFPGGTFQLCDNRGTVSAKAIVITESGRPRIGDQKNSSGVPLDHTGNNAIACP